MQDREYRSKIYHAGEDLMLPTAEHCQRACQLEDKCSFFSWTSQGHQNHRIHRYCWLFEDKDDLTIATVPGMVSGPAVCDFSTVKR